MASSVLKQIVCLILLVYLLIYLAHILHAPFETSSAAKAPSPVANHNRFDADILQAISANRTQNNVVISPISIQISLAFALLGAGGETARQMRLALRIPTTMSKFGIAKDCGMFLRRNFYSLPGASKDAPQLHMANRIYVDKSLHLVAQFNELAKNNFLAEAVPMQFDDKSSTVVAINKWVGEQTNGKVNKLLQPNEVNAGVGAILINAIHFKAKWRTPFSQDKTRKADFKTNNKRTVEVDMMFNENEYVRYANLPGLDATAVEMPYKDSVLSMLIILPNKVNGLHSLERILAKVDLRKIAEKLETKLVDVSLPKFRIEFDIDLKLPLLQLGIRAMFGHSPDFSGLFAMPSSPLQLNARHKAILDVNEAGSEAAAASYIKMDFKSTDRATKQFVADHPFFYAIRSQEVVYFAGHVAQF